MNPFDIFVNGNRGSNRRRRTDNITREYPISLEDLYKGKISKFRVTHKIICPVCKGVGGAEGCERPCSTCNGRGVRVRVMQHGNVIQQMQSPCTVCNGTGRVIDEAKRCKNCMGNKVVSETKTIEVSVDRGMKDGQKVVLPSAADEAPDAEAGDIIYIIREKPHPRFKRQGPDLLTQVEISLGEALCGFERYIEQLDGRKLHIRVPAGQVVKPGEVRVVSGEGMPVYGAPFQNGSLFIRFEVKFPDAVGEKEVAELKRLLQWPAQPAAQPNADEVTMSKGSAELFGHSVQEPQQSENVGQGRGVECRPTMRTTTTRARGEPTWPARASRLVLIVRCLLDTGGRGWGALPGCGERWVAMGCHGCLRFTMTTFTSFWLPFGFLLAPIRLPFDSTSSWVLRCEGRYTLIATNNTEL